MSDNINIKDYSGASVSVASDQVVDGTLGTVQFQYVKIADGTINSSNKMVVDANGSVQTQLYNSTTTGSITTQNLNPTGAATANSAVTVSAIGAATISVQVTGTYTGALSAQVSNDNANWITLTKTTTFVKSSDGSYSANIPSAGVDIWHLDSTAHKYFRISANAAVTGTASLTIYTSQEAAIVDVGRPIIGQGSNIIGSVGIDQTTPGTTNAVSVAQVGSTTVATGNGVVGTGVQRVAIASDNTAFSVNATATGNVANGASDSGNPIKIGGKALTTNPTAVSTTQRVDATFDKVGRQVVVNNHVREMRSSQTTTITSSTAETTFITAAGSGVYADIDMLFVSNKSATGTVVTIRDATAGTARYIAWCPAGSGFVLPGTLFTQTTANNNWTIQCTTSVDSIYVNANYIKNI